ncbi:unnamed protein product [Trifolium pratense]|uniref:Uncharacterized protein n=1 Tax=Trifolium pratense TaxID=57577 RepID=A0ACB0KIL7_TRIPR|nr:unnamed protein product [Trifolium pratense]
MERKTIDLDQGWAHMQSGIAKLKRILEGLPEPQFSSEEYMMMYTTIYNLCTQKPPSDYSQQIYDKYKGCFDEYIRTKVLSAVRDKHDEFMLRELVQRWSNHKIFVRWLSRFFHYLNRYYVPRASVPPLNAVGLSAFRDLVYTEVRANARKAVIDLIYKEREGEQIDGSLLKNVLDIFVAIGMGEIVQYEEDFEVQMLEDTANYYKSKATIWIESDSCPDYMIKAEDCLKRERERVSHYLHASTEQKLVETVQHELLVNRASNYSRRSTQDAVPCLEMIRWMISLGCIDSTIKYLKGWILLPMYSSSILLMRVQLWFNWQKKVLAIRRLQVVLALRIKSLSENS